MTDRPCWETEPAGTNHDPTTGQFVAGNKAAFKHGLTPRGGLARIEADLSEALRDRRAAVVADLGGEESISAVAEDIVSRYVVASAMLESVESRLLAEGPLTSKGKRKALHNVYVTQLDRVVKLASMLGLQRKARSVTVEDYVRQKAAEARAREAAR